MKYFLFTCVCMVLLFGAGCSNEGSGHDNDKKLYIVTTTGMVADAVMHIVGDGATVEALMGPGVDPHLYKATGSDLSKLNNADLIFYNGLHLEGKMTEVLHKLAAKKPVLGIGGALPKERLMDVGGAYDPHIWFDVELWGQAMPAIATRLGELDTANALKYANNAISYQKQLAELHSWVMEQMATIPSAQRILVTAHDAFGYFGRAYQVEVRGLQGISTVGEYGLKDVTNVVDLLVNKRINAVFVESSVSDKALKAVVEGAAAKGHEVKIGGTLYSDAMGAANTPEGTYIGMVKYNVTTIVEGLK